MNEIQIEDAIAQLKDTGFAIRRADMKFLAEVADASVVVRIIALLQDEDWRVRSRAAEALGEIGDPSAVPMLVDALKDQMEISIDSSLQHLYTCAAKALGKIGTAPAIFALRDMMKSDNLTVRCRAASALLEARDDSAVPALIEMLNAKEESLRLHVIRLLGESGDVAAIPGLIGMIQRISVPRPIQVAAAEALAMLGDSHTLPRKVLATSKFTVRRRLDLLDALRNLHFTARDYSQTVSVSYTFADNRKLCETVLQEEDELTRVGARALLNWLNGDQDLLHASTRPAANDGQILLRAAQGSGSETRPETLLLGSAAPEQEDAPSPATPPSWKRLFQKRLE